MDGSGGLGATAWMDGSSGSGVHHILHWLTYLRTVQESQTSVQMLADLEKKTHCCTTVLIKVWESMFDI
jgi:DNA-directed RNA polymerase subunit N (RpoN/RPB10)